MSGDFLSLAADTAESWRVAGTDGVGLRLYRLRGGARQGPVLVLGHCNGFAAGAYRAQLIRLATVADVFAFDHRGHGGAETPPGPPGTGFAAAALAGDVAAILDAVEALRPGARPLYVGHSLSAAAMLSLAIAAPQRYAALALAGLVLIEPPIFPDAGHALFAECTERTATLVARTLARRRVWPSPAAYAAALAGRGPFAAFAPGMREALALATLRPRGDGACELACAPESEAAIFALWGQPVLFPQLGRVPDRHPILLIGGDPATGPQRDWVTAMMADTAARLGHAAFRRMPGRGHLWPFEAPDAFFSLIAQLRDRPSLDLRNP